MLKYEHDVWPATGPIYGFDMDDTLINAHKTLIPGRAEKMQLLAKSGARIAIFTNQSRLKPETIAKRFDTLRGLGVPWRGFAATSPEMRKPSTAMAGAMILELFVGDAAGRPGDHSDDDLKFAAALECKFQVPELFFQNPGHDQDFGKSGLSPIPKPHAAKYNFGADLPTFDVILMCGMPASGKSEFARALAAEHKYVVISNDTKTSKQFATLRAAGTRIIIDNTHGTADQRAKFIDPAIDTAIVIMNTPEDVCRARNELRPARVSRIVYSVYNKKYEPPTATDGVWVFRTLAAA